MVGSHDRYQDAHRAYRTLVTACEHKRVELRELPEQIGTWVAERSTDLHQLVLTVIQPDPSIPDNPRLFLLITHKQHPGEWRLHIERHSGEEQPFWSIFVAEPEPRWPDPLPHKLVPYEPFQISVHEAETEAHRIARLFSTFPLSP